MNLKNRIKDKKNDAPAKLACSVNYRKDFSEEECVDSVKKLPKMSDNKNSEVTIGLHTIKYSDSSDQFYVLFGNKKLGSFRDPSSAVKFAIEDSGIRKVSDDEVVERSVNNKVYKTKKFRNAEEANKFLEQNEGYGVIDVENDEVYVALNEDKGKPV